MIPSKKLIYRAAGVALAGLVALTCAIPWAMNTGKDTIIIGVAMVPLGAGGGLFLVGLFALAQGLANLCRYAARSWKVRAALAAAAKEAAR